MTFEWDAEDPDIVRVDDVSYLIPEIDRKFFPETELERKRRERQEARHG